MTAGARDPEAGAPVLGVARSFLGNTWIPRLADPRAGSALASTLELPALVGQVLAARDVTPEAADDFLNPTLRRLLPDPLHLRDMDGAVARLAAAITGGERIGIFGDYDVDGATSSALLERFLRHVGAEATVYIPDRVREGYGPNTPALRMLAAQDVRVVVTVDCGTAAFAPLEAAAEAGLDVIVIDHHLAEARLPRAHAVVNPNRLDEESPHRALAAVGVAFLLVVGVNRALREAGWFGAERGEPDLREWLDLVALGTVCDVVPLVGLNRALVRQGLRVMAGRRNIGLAALADVGGLDQAPTPYHLGFVLGPRVNAGGRIGEPSLGARLLATDDPEEAAAIAARLDGLNRERRALEAAALEAAVEQVEAARRADAPLIVAAAADWHVGVIGIVASRLKERYGRPAIVVAVENGTGRASCRSVPGVDIGAAITAARQASLVVNGGGHPMAAGFTVETERLADLTVFLAERLGPAVAARGTERRIRIDGTLSPEGATVELVDTLARIGPFGAGNPEPRFAIADARVAYASIVGQGHVRCTLAGRSGAQLRGIAFRAADTALGQALLGGRDALVHATGKLRVDRRFGAERVELFIDDAASAASSAPQEAGHA